MFLSLSTSILLNLMPVLTSAGFKQRFTFIPLCKPMPSNSIGSLRVFCKFFAIPYLYTEGQKCLEDNLYYQRIQSNFIT